MTLCAKISEELTASKFWVQDFYTLKMAVASFYETVIYVCIKMYVNDNGIDLIKILWTN
jgi:hypothetical protein